MAEMTELTHNQINEMTALIKSTAIIEMVKLTKMKEFRRTDEIERLGRINKNYIFTGIKEKSERRGSQK